MSYFVPSFFQKRILRYALSRLELLDTDALDLDKLDIVWGKKSTVELREVGIHTKKLAALLELPRSLAIVSAKILFLRLTVPADLNKSGILVEAHGVNVDVNADLREQEKRKTTSPKRQKSQQETRSKGVKLERPRSPQTHVHDPGGPKFYQPPIVDSDDEEEPSECLPTTTDLAKSFLQAEPKEKKEELQAAIAQFQNLDESQISSEDGSEPSGLGLGSPISLPGFLADFLKGVGDRIQLRVKDVILNVTIKVDLPSEGSARSDASDKSELVTFRLAVEDISLDGVTSVPAATTRDGVQGATNPNSRQIRRFTLQSLEAMIISEASLFTNLARSTSPSSPETTHARTMERSSNKLAYFPAPVIGLEMSPSHPAARYNKQADLKSSGFEGQLDNIANAENVDNKAQHSISASRYAPGESQYHDSSPADPFYLEEAHRSQLGEGPAPSGNLPGALYSDPANVGNSSLLSFDLRRHVDEASHGDKTPPAILHPMAQGVPSPGNDENGLGCMPEDPSDFTTRGRPSSLPDHRQPKKDDSGGFALRTSSPVSDGTSPGFEDLSQSKLFSHEEAESMYMSAISHASAGTNNRGGSIPGYWESSDSETDHEAGTTSFSRISSRLPDRSGSGLRKLSPHTGARTAKTHIDSEEEKISGSLGSQLLERAATHRPERSAVVQTEAEAPPRNVRQGNVSSEGSETSSTEFKNSFTLAKRIFTVDTITVEHPQVVSDAANSPTDIHTSRNIAKVPIPSSSAEKSPDPNTLGTSSIRSKAGKIPDKYENTDPLAIFIGSLHVLGDMGLTRMTILIIQQMTSMHKPATSKSKKTDASQSASSSKSHLQLSIKEVCWKFLDVVRGLPVKHSRPEQTKLSFPSDPEVLLRADIKNLKAAHYSNDSSSTLRASLGKFSFGYASDNILSFDSALKLRESTRDMLAPNNDDTELAILRSGAVTEIEVTTLPLHITLDLRRLDETFGWFGGLSSMLDLGSSMVSTVTTKDAVSKPSRPNKTTRGVHFDSSYPSKQPQATPKQTVNQIVARVGGLVFDLKGSQTSLRVESTALKLTNHKNKVNVQIDRMKLSGPHPYSANSEPSIVMKLRNLRIEYLSTPLDIDLDRLVTLLSPSNDRYERDDDILLDTLLRQRSKGGVVRLTLESLKSQLSSMDDLQCFPALIEDLKKLSTVAKYLPEDDRPGMLTLVLIRTLKIGAAVNSNFGVADLVAQDLELAHVTFPVLMALAVKSVSLHRNATEVLVSDARPKEVAGEPRLPLVMARFIGNEMEPTAKVKLYNAQFEYHVSTVMAIMGYKEATDAESIVDEMVSSVATLTARNLANKPPPKISSQSSVSINMSASNKALKFDVVLRDSIIGLNPRNSEAKGLIVLTDTHFLGAMPKEDEANATLEIKRAAIMVIDDAANCVLADRDTKRQTLDGKRSQIEALSDAGYVTVSSISAAKAVIQLEAHPKAIDIEIRDDLFVLETCADSTHTLQSIMSGLNPPTPPSAELKYRTEVIPVEDMLASFTGDAFETRQVHREDDENIDGGLPLGLDEGDLVDDEVPQNLEYVSSFYNPDPDALSQGITESMLEEDLESLAAPSMIREIGDKNLLESFQEQTQVAPGDMTLDFQDDHFGSSSTVGGIAHRWDATENTYGVSNDSKLRSSPLRVRVRDVHFIWNLFDGYDWQHTRDVITQAVEEVQSKATERITRMDKRRSRDLDEEQEAVIGDFLFNSIYIGIPANRDPKELARQVNRDIDDLVSETDTYAISSTSGSPSRQGHAPRLKKRRLRLMRSKHHKMAFELKGISADVVVFPPNSGETQSSIDVRIQDLEIYDHLPTSTWRKFATYLHDIGERESGTSMVHLEILNVKPVPDLAASEMMLKVSY